MSYLSFEEYKSLTGSGDDQKSDFEKNVNKAEILLDDLTGNFYQFNELSKDTPFRSNRFKNAICAQIQYFIEMDGNTFESINKAPQSFSLGRTQISNGSRYNASGENESKALVPEDVYIYLEGTGLLYRGVKRC